MHFTRMISRPARGYLPRWKISREGSQFRFAGGGFTRRVLVPSGSVTVQLPHYPFFCAGKLGAKTIAILNGTISFKHTVSSTCHFRFLLLLFIRFLFHTIFSPDGQLGAEATRK